MRTTYVIGLVTVVLAGLVALVVVLVVRRKSDPVASEVTVNSESGENKVVPTQPTLSENELVSRWLQDRPVRRRTQHTPVAEAIAWGAHQTHLTSWPSMSVRDVVSVSLAAGGSFVALGVRKLGTVYVYDVPSRRLVHKLQGPPDFGRRCAMRADGKRLVVQAHDTSYIYGPDFQLIEEDVKIASEYDVVHVTPDDAIWTQRLQPTEFSIRGQDSAHAGILYDVSFESESNHAWLATSGGLQHWSWQLEWRHNTTWFTGAEVSSVDQAQHLLAFSYAHLGKVCIARADNPTEVLVTLEPAQTEGGMFGNCVRWAPDASCLWVSAPRDIGGAGAIYTYDQHGVLQAMFQGHGFGHELVVLDAHTALVTSETGSPIRILTLNAVV